MKHLLIVDLENEFGSRIWEPIHKNDYQTKQEDIIKIFKLYDLHMFNGRLPKMRCIIRQTDAPVLAAFAFGMVRGTPVLMHVFNAKFCSFFMLMNCIAHELIHAYDWVLGPLSKMYEFYNAIRCDSNVQSSYNKGHPTQVTYSNQFPNYRIALAAKSRVYDCHGRWFWNQATKFNDIGFDVSDVFNPYVARKNLRKIDEDIDEMPLDLRNLNDDSVIRLMYDNIKNSEHKVIRFRDALNWFIEIS